MSDSNIKTIHATSIIHDLLLQAIVWAPQKQTSVLFEFNQTYQAALKQLNSNKEPNKELIEAVIGEYKRVSAQLPKS